MAARKQERSKSSGQRYTVTLPPRAENDLDIISTELQISKAEAFRRALSLYKHAIDADKVVLKKGGKEQRLLVK